jgi:hypothetical protein
MIRKQATSSFWLNLVWLAAAGLALVGAVGPSLAADDTAGDAEKLSPLGVRQQRVERMMDDLEKKFESLAQTLIKQGEKERGERLQKALNEAKTLGVHGRMIAITKLLNDQQLDSAIGEQKKTLDDVKKLLELLLKDDKEDKASQLEKWKKDLEAIIKDEMQQEKESNKVANKDETLDKLGKQIAAVQKLIKDQTDVIGKTGEARAKGAQALGPVADKQRAVR